MARKKRYQLVEYRKKHGLSQEELGAIIKCSQRQISQFENCKIILRREILDLLAFELGITIGELLEER